MSPRRVGAEDGDVLLDLATLLLHDALADPGQIADLLQLQVAVAVVARQVELAVEAALQQSHLVQVEGIIHRHLLALDRRLEHALVHPVLVQRAAQAVHVLAVVQRLHALGVQKPDRGQQRVADVAQLGLYIRKGEEANVVVDGVEGVEDQIDRHRVGLRLQDLAHHLSSVAALRLRPVVEVLQVVLLHALLHQRDRAVLQQRLHQLRTMQHVVLRLLVQVAAEVLAHGDLDQHDLEELLEALGGVLEGGDRAHDVVGEHAQGVTLLLQLLQRDGGVGNGQLQNQDDVIDHELVAMRDLSEYELRSEIHHLSEGLRGLSAHERPLIGQLFQSAATEGAREQRRLLAMRRKQ